MLPSIVAERWQEINRYGPPRWSGGLVGAAFAVLVNGLVEKPLSIVDVGNPYIDLIGSLIVLSVLGLLLASGPLLLYTAVQKRRKQA